MSGPWQRYAPAPAAPQAPWAKYANPQALAAHDAAVRAGTTPGWERAMDQGFSFNGGNLLDAGLAAGITGLHNAVSHATGRPDAGYGMSQAFDAVRQADAQAEQQYAQQHPLANLVSGAVGAAANPLNRAGGRFVARAGSVPAAMARGVVVGAPTGAAYGALGAQPGHEIQGGMSGAATGAAFGAGAPAVSGVISKAGGVAASVAKNAVGRRLGMVSPDQVARSRLAEALAKDASAGVDASAPWPGASKPTLADLAGENVRAVVRNAGSSQGPARQVLAKYRDRVASNLQDHALSLTAQLTPGEARTAPAFADALSKEQGLAADRMYPVFRADPIPVTDTVVSALSGKTGAGALSAAAKLADARRDQEVLAEIAALRNGQPGGTVSAGALDLIQRGLRDSAGTAYQGGENTLGSGLKDRAKDLSEALMASPGFSAARKTFENYAQQIEAVDHGGTVLNASPSTYTPLLAGAAPEVQTAAQVGARQALTDAIGRPTEGAVGTLNRISTATNPGQNLDATYGADAADAYRRGLAAEVDRMSNANFMAPNLGSQSTPRQQDLLASLLHGAHGVGKIIGSVVSGPPLSDAERSAIVQQGIGDMTPETLATLLAAKKAPMLLPGTGYATPVISAMGGSSAGASN